MTNILVVADIKQGELKGSTAELLSKARALGADTAVVAVGSQVKDLAEQLAAAGSDTQYIVEDASLEIFSAKPFAAAVVKAANEFNADMVWFGFSETGKAAAPRVAVQLEAACATEIIDVTIDGDAVQIIRPAIANKVLQKLKVNAPNWWPWSGPVRLKRIRELRAKKTWLPWMSRRLIPAPGSRS